LTDFSRLFPTTHWLPVIVCT